ncbi:MAG TPA: enoyl-CoA hydratase/isomerase family protein [Kofleriaceae bacterium]|nr:enoyl-CoA hydratase/isomerase family protein [Kofleriaceae bacterium]
MIELRDDDGIAVMTMAAGRANAIDGPFLDGLADGLDRAVRERPRALVLTGAGSTFSAGLALPTLIELDRGALREVMHRFTRVMRQVLELPLPTVAAINGPAIAGGCVLALMCDQRVMVGDGAKGAPRIGLNESQLGIGLPAVVVEVARHKLPATSFVAVALAGALFEARRALDFGLIDEVATAADLAERAMTRARAMTASGPDAYAQIKQAWNRPIVDAIAGTDEPALEAWLDTWFSADGQARLRAIVSWLKKPVT